MYNLAKKLKETAVKLDRENINNRTRLQEALDYVESGELLKNKVNKTTLRFLQSQIELQQKKSRGRRFTMEDKIFALSIFKQSRKGYRLLEKLFALPSKATLIKLLKKIPLHCGINQPIINVLKTTVEKMSPQDRCCILMYDEMTIDTALSYSLHDDKIVGFEDHGDDNVKSGFADHALVFMARGIFRKWKQPIAYYYTQGGMNSSSLAVLIKNVIQALQATGLIVVASVSDQLSTNIAANNILKKQTAEMCIKDNIENRYFGFVVGDQEIVCMYDVPHLLKGIRNNTLEADVQFKWLQDKIQLASWRDVVALYELDVGTEDFKMCNKLTDHHIYKDKIKKMKVKNAAQVFSQRVSSVMRFLAKRGIKLIFLNYKFF